ncbi:hypothetical protein SKAU_G00006980 [Synaphobranchus kaupii]|uniref:Uncharacterized protein n=1 Tax=Synaphobranchus kaupii TaxID=118154 RepID=A0A9Q1JCK1_SYNKA|nr:hypothetical protein SKAU_G00006980 [Synaphobranchus kaupii]
MTPCGRCSDNLKAHERFAARRLAAAHCGASSSSWALVSSSPAQAGSGSGSRAMGQPPPGTAGSGMLQNPN